MNNIFRCEFWKMKKLKQYQTMEQKNFKWGNKKYGMDIMKLQNNNEIKLNQDETKQ